MAETTNQRVPIGEPGRFSLTRFLLVSSPFTPSQRRAIVFSVELVLQHPRTDDPPPLRF